MRMVRELFGATNQSREADECPAWAWFLTLVSGSAATRSSLNANHESDDHQKLSLHQRRRRCHLQFPRVSKKSRDVPPTRLAPRQGALPLPPPILPHVRGVAQRAYPLDFQAGRLKLRRRTSFSSSPSPTANNSLLVNATQLALLITIAKRCPRNPLLLPLVDNPANPLLVPVPVRDENKLLINNAVMLPCTVSPRSCAFSPSLSSLCSLFHRAWLHP